LLLWGWTADINIGKGRLQGESRSGCASFVLVQSANTDNHQQEKGTEALSAVGFCWRMSVSTDHS